MAQVLAYDSDPNMSWDVASSLGHDVRFLAIPAKP